MLLNFIMFTMYDMLIFSYEKRIEEVTVEELNKRYNNQLNLVKVSVDKFSSFKHDMNRHFGLLISYLEIEQYKKASNYLKTMVSEVSHKNSFSNTGNLVIDSIINFELDINKCEKVKVSLESKNIPEILKIEDFDLTIIISNQIRNAYEATIKLDNNRNISIVMEYQKGMFYLEIENSFDGVVYADKNGLKSTKKEKKEHGIGLRNVKRTVEKYNGVLNTQHENFKFIIEVMLYTFENDHH